MAETHSYVPDQAKMPLSWDTLEKEISKLGAIPAAKKLLAELDETEPTDQANLTKIFDKITTVRRRKLEIANPQAPHKFESSLAPKENELEKQALAKLKDILAHATENGTLLGTGTTAQVYDDPNQTVDLPGNRCYKLIYNHQLYENHNVVSQEADLQSDLADININGTRVPKPHYAVQNGNFQLFTMEKLNAHNLDDILKGKAPLPPTFDSKTFFSNLENFVATMHERRIYHRDLHEGNIMVDKETGLPYIIDFGQACRALADDNPYQKNGPAIGKVKVYPNDDDKVKEIKKLLQEFLKKSN